MKNLGSGIALYFWFVQKLCAIFFLLSLFSVPIMLLTINSTSVIDSDPSLYYSLFETTIGKMVKIILVIRRMI